ncbi:MAG: mannose-1-phosphate guanylyltransferase [Candidatus Hydrogenedentes bacterium]|nr:mannose-1-phosphate guanylyltransferase [Candidatus Hydrogenedentota bacterium]
MCASENSGNTCRMTALIMAGGIGERFWPLSTPTKPKQLLPFGENGKTLIEEAVERIRPLVSEDNLWIATSETLKPIFRNLRLCPETQILAEPFRKNTAGCIAFAVASMLAKCGDDIKNSVMAVLTADHLIKPEDKFIDAVKRIINFVSSNPLLGIIGIKPTRPDTGYGYIESGEEISEGIYKVIKFHEKPNSEEASEYLKRGNYFWNSGMFFWKVETFLNELRVASPQHYESILKMREAMIQNRYDDVKETFNSLPNISIDYALMECSSNIAMVKAEFFWDDLGSWNSLERIFTPDDKGNVIKGEWIGCDTTNCIIYNADKKDLTIATLGIDNIVVAVVENVVLVMNKHNTQKIKNLLSKYYDME